MKKATVLLVVSGLTLGTAGSADAATVDECKNGAWRTVRDASGQPFKNQGQCVSYVDQGGEFYVPPVLRVDQFGWAYSDQGATDTWTTYLAVFASGLVPGNEVLIDYTLSNGDSFLDVRNADANGELAASRIITCTRNKATGEVTAEYPVSFTITSGSWTGSWQRTTGDPCASVTWPEIVEPSLVAETGAWTLVERVNTGFGIREVFEQPVRLVASGLTGTEAVWQITDRNLITSSSQVVVNEITTSQVTLPVVDGVSVYEGSLRCSRWGTQRGYRGVREASVAGLSIQFPQDCSTAPWTV